MKTVRNLFESITSFQNLLLAETRARRGKRSRRDVALFHHNLEWELLRLQRELQAQTYLPGNYRTFTINDTKPRLISAAPYRDRVVHHALCNVIEPIFEPTLVFDTYANRRGKGQHAAVDRLTTFMRRADYVLKCDIARFFPSIDHAHLKRIIRRKIACTETLWLADRIIDASNPQMPVTDYYPGDDLFTPLERRKGLPLGNQTSQFFANLYLSPLDHFIQETLRCRHYIRYVDDFVLLGDDKATLWEYRDAITVFLAEHLRLKLHPKKQFVCPVEIGVDFLGYRVFPEHRLLRRSNGVRFERRLRTMVALYNAGKIDVPQVRQRISSWFGHARHADTWALTAAVLGKAVFSRAKAPVSRSAGWFLEQQ